MNTITNFETETAPVNFYYDNINKQIVGTRRAFNLSGNPNSPLYKELMARIAEQPTYTFQVIERKKNEDKKTYEGLTFNLMIDYLDTLSDYLGISDPEKSAAVEAFRNSLEDMRVDKVPFGHRKKAFLEKFPNFNVAKAKAFIREQHFEALKEDYEIVRWGEPETGSNVIPYNPASGQ